MVQNFVHELCVFGEENQRGNQNQYWFEQFMIFIPKWPKSIYFEGHLSVCGNTVLNEQKAILKNI